MSDFVVTVVFPAGGQGTRMGGTRKQFRTLGGRPLLVRTLSVFDRHPGIDHFVVVVPEDSVKEVRLQLEECGLTSPVRVVAGGATRQASVVAGVAAVPEETTHVLVHDAVRPFVSRDVITAVIEAAVEIGAAAPAVPVSDTLRRAEGDRFGETVPRTDLYRMQTPQGFRIDRLREAQVAAEKEAFIGTDEVALVQRQGHPVALVPGSERNFKVTTPADWALAQMMIDHKS